MGRPLSLWGRRFRHNKNVPPLTFVDARETVLRVVRAARQLPVAETVCLSDACGRSRVAVFRRPAVAIIATGDEIVEVQETPREFQIRNSNAYSLAAQVTRAGGTPRVLPIARDTFAHTREVIAQALDADLVLL